MESKEDVVWLREDGEGCLKFTIPSDVNGAMFVRAKSPETTEADVTLNDLLCTWTTAFDGHFNISCVGETGQRANGGFRSVWKFKHCPYCGRQIEQVTSA